MIDPATVQILFADLQPAIVARSKTNPAEALKASAGVLAKAAEVLKLPVHFSIVPDSNKAPELIPELIPWSATSTPHQRLSADPFLDAETVKALTSTKRKLLVIAGFATEVVVVHAACSARKAGYEVLVPVDACGGMSGRTEDATFRQIEAAGGVTTSVVGLVTALAPDFSHSPGKETFEILQSLRLA